MDQHCPADVVRKVVSFELFDSTHKDYWVESNNGNRVELKTILPLTRFYMQKDGNLISGETGIKYELSAAHLSTLCDNYASVSSDRSLCTDYLMQTSLNQCNNDYMRVVINWTYILPNLRPNSKQYMKFLSAQKERRRRSEYAPLVTNDQIIAKTQMLDIKNYEIIGFCAYPAPAKIKYTKASLQGNKIIVEENEPYNNEGIIHTGEMDISQTDITAITRTMASSKDVSQCYVYLQFTRNDFSDGAIALLVKKSEVLHANVNEKSQKSKMSYFLCGGILCCLAAFFVYCKCFPIFLQ